MCLYWLTGHGKFQLSLVSGLREVVSVDFTLYLCLEVFCWQIGLFVPSQGTKSVVGFHTTIRQFFLFPKNKEIYDIASLICSDVLRPFLHVWNTLKQEATHRDAPLVGNMT